MQKLITLPVVALLALAVSGCHLVYTPDVRQGNLLDKTIDQKAVDQLKPGLTKRQVLLLLGTPSVATPFDQNRWDYVSTQSRRNAQLERRLTLLSRRIALIDAEDRASDDETESAA